MPIQSDFVAKIEIAKYITHGAILVRCLKCTRFEFAANSMQIPYMHKYSDTVSYLHIRCIYRIYRTPVIYWFEILCSSVSERRKFK